MKHKLCKTSSLLINLDGSSFDVFQKLHEIYEYALPAYFQDRYNEYGILHNWAKDNLSVPYYLNIPSKKLYLLTEKHEHGPLLSYEAKSLPSQSFNDFWAPNKLHIILKLLQAKYFESTESFVSNDKFFLYASLNRAKSWATVLRVELLHNYKNREAVEFFVRDEANRLKGITKEEFQKYYQKDIIYGQSIRNGQLYFKQLKRSEIVDFKGQLFAKPKSGFVGNTKAKIDFHSIMDAEDHEASKSFLLERFSENFKEFARSFGIDIRIKELNLEKVQLDRQKTALPLGELTVCLVDGRRVKKTELMPLLSSYCQGNLTLKTESEVSPGDNCLFVMDYNREDFQDKLMGEVDPYHSFKLKVRGLNIVTQGICINENFFDDSRAEMTLVQYFIYEGLCQKDLERNVSICLSQLYLKRLLADKDAKHLPLASSLDNVFFAYRNHLLFTKSGLLNIQKFDSPADLLSCIQTHLPSLDLAKLEKDIYEYHHPFGTGDFDFLTHKFIFDKESVIEIIDIPERAFYEEAEIRERIKERNKQRAKSEFKSSNNDPFSQAFNSFLDEDVDDAILSFEELKSNYGKNDEGFLRRIFNAKDERALVSYLNEHTQVRVKGLKEGGVFSTYTGVWFDSEQLQYFVGRTHGYQYKQDKGAQMRKVLVFDGAFNSDLFFQLLNVDFVRYKEVTVVPFLFKLIEMREFLEQTTELMISSGQEGQM